MKDFSVLTSPRIASHLRNLARDVAYTEGHAAVMRSAADRIEALETEREEWERSGYVPERLRRIAAEEHANRAEAALARVTDDSMAERIAAAIDDPDHWETSLDQQSADLDTTHAASAVLAKIRAVAARKQIEAMRCLGCDADPNAPHNGNGDCRNQHPEAPR